MSGETFIKKAYDAILAHDFERAIAFFEKAIEANPLQADYHYKLSVTCVRSGHLIRALREAETALSLEPGSDTYKAHVRHVQAKVLLSDAQRRMESRAYGEALTKLKQATALDPLLGEAFLMMGVAHACLKEYVEAIYALRELLKLDPLHTEGNRLMAEYQRKLREY
ncbi:tetratricopeptide repeat protein [Paenibacillus sp. CC-CFT747]|nr:tetratricopeptide repeat protein [Paenibacillus sp. CC-CFT747]